MTTIIPATTPTAAPTTLRPALEASPVHRAYCLVPGPGEETRILSVIHHDTPDEEYPEGHYWLHVYWLTMGAQNWEPMHDFEDLTGEITNRGAGPDDVVWIPARNPRVRLSNGRSVNVTK